MTPFYCCRRRFIFKFGSACSYRKVNKKKRAGSSFWQCCSQDRYLPGNEIVQRGMWYGRRFTFAVQPLAARGSVFTMRFSFNQVPSGEFSLAVDRLPGTSTTCREAPRGWCRPWSAFYDEFSTKTFFKNNTGILTKGEGKEIKLSIFNYKC